MDRSLFTPVPLPASIDQVLAIKGVERPHHAWQLTQSATLFGRRYCAGTVFCIHERQARSGERVALSAKRGNARLGTVQLGGRLTGLHGEACSPKRWHVLGVVESNWQQQEARWRPVGHAAHRVPAPANQSPGLLQLPLFQAA